MARWLVLDLDGTLVDSVPDLRAALNRLMAARGLAGFTASEVAAMVGDGARVLVERGFAARGQVADEGAVASFLVDYTAHAADLSEAYPGVHETLTALRAAGWTMAVCTNKPAVPARALLAGLKLDGFFAAVGGGDSFPVRKPNPAHLLSTLAAAGGTPYRAVMVGDHHNDIAAASAAGIASVWAKWGYGREVDGASEAADGFRALPAILDRLVVP